MRSDMSKIIVERPRPGSSRHVPRRLRRLDPKNIALTDDEDDRFPSRIGHKRAASMSQRKWLNENLAPLRRFLAKQVGRPWDAVWSEVSSHIRSDNVVQQHVRDHIKDFVAYRTFVKNGQVYIADRFSRPMPVSECWVELYVDPRTGLLRRNRAYHARLRSRRKADIAEAEKLEACLRIIGPDQQLHLLRDGNWWEVTLAPEPAPRSGASAPAVDVIERAGLCSLPREKRYGRRGVYATAKRPLSRKEIKALGLRAQRQAVRA